MPKSMIFVVNCECFQFYMTLAFKYFCQFWMCHENKKYKKKLTKFFNFSVKPTLKKVSKYENKFAKLQKKAAEFNFRNQLKVVKKKEFTLEEEDKEVRNEIIFLNFIFHISLKIFKISSIFYWINHKITIGLIGLKYEHKTELCKIQSLYIHFFMSSLKISRISSEFS